MKKLEMTLERIPEDPLFDEIRAKIMARFVLLSMNHTIDSDWSAFSISDPVDLDILKGWDRATWIYLLHIDACRNNSDIRHVHRLYACLFFSLVNADRIQLAIRVGDAILEHAEGNFGPNQQFMYVYAKCCLANGKNENAFKALRRLAKGNTGAKSFFARAKNDVDFQSIHRSREFLAIEASAHK